MAIDKAMRHRIDHLMAVYLNHLERHQGGWHSESALYRLARFKGDIPPPSGMDTSNDFMLRAAAATARDHAQLVLVRHLIGQPQPCPDCGAGHRQHCASCGDTGVRLVQGILKPERALVLLADRYWASEPAHVISGRLGLTPRQYDGRLARAREEMASELRYYDQVRALVLEAEGLRARQTCGFIQRYT